MNNSDNNYMEKIVFFYPKNEVVSGAFLMFLELAGYLSKNTSHKVYYIHWTNPELTEEYKDSQLIMLDYATFDDYESLTGAAFVVSFNYLTFLLPKVSMLDSSKLLLMAWHPYIFEYMFSQFIYHNGIKVQLLEFFSQHNALAFMDEVNRVEAKVGTNIEFRPQYVPVPYNCGDVVEPIPLKSTADQIEVGWLGRLDADKVYSVINLIENLYNSGYQINLHIIGDGNARSRIALSKYAPQINFIFTSYLLGDDLKSYIADHIDLLVAPGQASLVGASLQIPVIIPCIGNRRYYSDKYVYLFDCKNYSLGWRTKTLCKLGYQSNGITYYLSEILVPGNKAVLGRKCYDYAVKNHSVKHSFECLLNVLGDTSLTIADCMNLAPIKRHFKEFDLYERFFHKDYLAYIRFTPRLNKVLRAGWWQMVKSSAKLVIRKLFELLKRLVNVPLRIIDKMVNWITNMRFYYKIQDGYQSKIEVIKKHLKEQGALKVAFMVIFDSVFPAVAIFEEMLGMTEFDPYIIVVPDVSRGREYMIKNLAKTYDSLATLYPGRVINGYDAGWDSYLEVEEEYQLVFFSNPYRKMVRYSHSLNYFFDKNVLTLYADYGFPAVKYARQVFKTSFYSLVWKVFTDSQITYRDLCVFQPIKGRNSYVSGYIKMDKLAKVKLEQRTRKRILICPHHTVMGWNSLDISNFNRYSELFIRLPQEYPEIDFVFRPHPLLFVNLRNKRIWSEEQVEDYMNRLLASPNMNYDESGEYFALFANSDGMIHDCSSYIGEYLFTEKPCCYMLKDQKQIKRVYSKVGRMCLENYYKAFDESGIYDFIENVIIKGNDEMEDKRKEFVSTVLKPNYPNSSSKAIDYILNQIS